MMDILTIRSVILAPSCTYCILNPISRNTLDMPTEPYEGETAFDAPSIVEAINPAHQL